MKEKIIEIASRIFGVQVNEISSQDNTPEWDSLHHLNLIIELEMEFNVCFEPEKIAEMKNIESIEKVIERK